MPIEGSYTYTVADNTATITAYSGAGGALSIPATLGGYPVVAIGTNVFFNKTSITSVVIPNSIITIGFGVFYGCSSITSVTFTPTSKVTTLGGSAFSGCSALTSITIPDSVIYIGSYTFQGCNNLTSITIPNNVTSLGQGALQQCSKLTSIIVPDNVTTFGNWMFYGNTSLTSVTLGTGITTTGDYAFMDCTSLTSFTISNNITTIGQSAFSRCPALTSVTIGSSVTTIGGNAFYECPALTSITIPASVTTIGNSAFRNCALMTSINVDIANLNYSSIDGVLYNKAITIMSQCPDGKTGELIIPDTVVEIGNTFPFNESKLTSIVIGSGIAYIETWSFCDCSLLMNVFVDSNNAYFSDIDGVLYNKDATVLNYYPCGRQGEYIVPDGVITIRDGAFAEMCFGLTSVILPDSLTTIEYYAFYECRGLSSIVIPDNVTYIGEECFYNCILLISVTIGESVATIADFAFDYCTSLETINFRELISPTIEAATWIEQVPATARGHALINSNFPLPGEMFNGLMMGDYLYYTPSVPTVFVVTATAVGELYLTWEVPLYEGAGVLTAYNIYSSKTTPIYLATIGTEVTYYTDKTPVNGETWNYQVSASNILGEGELTSIQTGTAWDVPDAPTDLMVAPGNLLAILSWEAPLDTGGAPITGYNIYRSGSEIETYTLISSTETITCIDADVSYGETYWYKVKAVTAAGEGGFSNAVFVVVVTTPGCPNNLHGVPDFQKTTIIWEAPLFNGGRPIVNYKLYRASSSDGIYILTATTIELFKTDLDVTGGAAYWYKVSAVNSIGEGELTEALRCASLAGEVYREIDVVCGMGDYPTVFTSPVINVKTENDIARLQIIFPRRFMASSYRKIIDLGFYTASEVYNVESRELTYDGELEKYTFIISREYTYGDRLYFQFRALLITGQEAVDPGILYLKFRDSIKTVDFESIDSAPTSTQTEILEDFVQQHGNVNASTIHTGHVRIDNDTIVISGSGVISATTGTYDEYYIGDHIDNETIIINGSGVISAPYDIVDHIDNDTIVINGSEIISAPYSNIDEDYKITNYAIYKDNPDYIELQVDKFDNFDIECFIDEGWVKYITNKNITGHKYVKIFPSKFMMIDSDSTISYTSQLYSVVPSTNYECNMLLYFDLRTVPSNATIVKAELYNRIIAVETYHTGGYWIVYPTSFEPNTYWLNPVEVDVHIMNDSWDTNTVWSSIISSRGDNIGSFPGLANNDVVGVDCTSNIRDWMETPTNNNGFLMRIKDIYPDSSLDVSSFSKEEDNYITKDVGYGQPFLLIELVDMETSKMWNSKNLLAEYGTTSTCLHMASTSNGAIFVAYYMDITLPPLNMNPPFSPVITNTYWEEEWINEEFYNNVIRVEVDGEHITTRALSPAKSSEIINGETISYDITGDPKVYTNGTEEFLVIKEIVYNSTQASYDNRIKITAVTTTEVLLYTSVSFPYIIGDGSFNPTNLNKYMGGDGKFVGEDFYFTYMSYQLLSDSLGGYLEFKINLIKRLSGVWSESTIFTYEKSRPPYQSYGDLTPLIGSYTFPLAESMYERENWGSYYPREFALRIDIFNNKVYILGPIYNTFGKVDLVVLKVYDDIVNQEYIDLNIKDMDVADPVNDSSTDFIMRGFVVMDEGEYALSYKLYNIDNGVAKYAVYRNGTLIRSGKLIEPYGTFSNIVKTSDGNQHMLFTGLGDYDDIWGSALYLRRLKKL